MRNIDFARMRFWPKNALAASQQKALTTPRPPLIFPKGTRRHMADNRQQEGGRERADAVQTAQGTSDAVRRGGEFAAKTISRGGEAGAEALSRTGQTVGETVRRGAQELAESQQQILQNAAQQ